MESSYRSLCHRLDQGFPLTIKVTALKRFGVIARAGGLQAEEHVNFMNESMRIS
ncbi:hypothetical protein WN943_013766 [Citrus x changshan-huyou]